MKNMFTSFVLLGWDYLGMAHTYKKLLAEDAECRACWSGSSNSSNGSSSSSSSNANSTLLFDAAAPYALRLGELKVRSLQAILRRDHGAGAVQRLVFARTPMLKFNGTFAGDLKDMPALRASAAATSEENFLGSSSSSSSSSRGSSSSNDVTASTLAFNLPSSTLRRLLVKALRPTGESGYMNIPRPMTWEALLETAEPPRSKELPALMDPVPF